jgi:hypothetical protein
MPEFRHEKTIFSFYNYIPLFARVFMPTKNALPGGRAFFVGS